MTEETIAESTFLITELRYTLSQLHVQLSDLGRAREHTQVSGGTLSELVTEMIERERQFQSRYGEILQVQPTQLSNETELALPINEADGDPDDDLNRFEHLRSQTVAMLEQQGEAWPDQLLSAVREQIVEDRKMVTAIAESRIHVFEEDQRPDLDEPLTTKPDVHALGDQTAYDPKPEPFSG